MAGFWNSMMEKRKRREQLKRINEEGHDGYDWYEGQTKWPVTRIVEVAFAVISVVIWSIVLFRIFSSGNAEYEKMILLNEKAAEVYPNQVSQVTRIHSSTEEQEDGSVLVYYPIYMEEVDNMQFTARVRRRALPPGEGELGYTFILRESGDGGTQYYSVSYYAMEKNISYTFFRLCFEGVEFKEDCVYTFLVFQGGYEAPQEEENPYPVTSSLFRFTIYNSSTYINQMTPKESVYKKM